MSDCRHGLNSDWCGLCRAEQKTVLVLEGPTIAARYRDKCTGCGDPIVPGEDIHLTESGWVCTSCARRAVS